MMLTFPRLALQPLLVEQFQKSQRRRIIQQSNGLAIRPVEHRNQFKMKCKGKVEKEYLGDSGTNR